MCRHIWHTPKISRKFAKSVVLRSGRKPNWVNLFRGIIFQGTWHGLYVSREAKERNAPVVDALTPVFLFVYGMITLICQSFATLPEHQATWHTRINKKFHLDSRLWAFQVGFHHNPQPSQLSVFWQQGRLQLQWWYFPPPNVSRVCSVVLMWLGLKDLNQKLICARNSAGWELDTYGLSPTLCDSNMLECNHQFAKL